MDPQAFIRLSIGSLGLRIPETVLKSGIHAFSSPCSCEIRLRGFPVQTTSVPLVSSPEATPDIHSIASSFYLEESDLKTLLTPGCFYTHHACLEIVVFTGRKGSHCGVGIKRHQIGTFKLEVGPEWGEGKPAVLFNGWIVGRCDHIKSSDSPASRLHQAAYIQLQVQSRQGVSGGSIEHYWSTSVDGIDLETERRERKGWKVKIHDLSGSAVAAAFITTPFVPSTGCDWVAKSNPGAWLIVRPDVCRPESWQPWGKLEAWRERGIRSDSICCRFHLLSESQEGGEVLMSEIFISAEKGGEFFIDTDRQLRAASTPIPSPQSSGDFSGLGPTGGFVMSCRVQGEGKHSKPLVQLAMRHVTCVEDAAIFMALAVAVDLSIVACRPFRRRLRRGSRHSL
ncbi:hypothetical protein GH714_004426 [Hevea brasiliensis]|uniref:Uncharacterized protein n=1 Tax=Hevea brasiliensis TaxID=3981 RepID=A0A6A6KIG8_HEVBR|nr:hypothetical protein GH714_004426 [Hevea brasiliensis]